MGFVDLCVCVILFLQQRMKASSTAEKLRHYAALVADAETRVQQLDKLRVVHDDYQKLVGDLIPATEAALKQLLEEKPRLTEVHEDVRYYCKATIILGALLCIVMSNVFLYSQMTTKWICLLVVLLRAEESS